MSRYIHKNTGDIVEAHEVPGKIRPGDSKNRFFDKSIVIASWCSGRTQGDKDMTEVFRINLFVDGKYTDAKPGEFIVKTAGKFSIVSPAVFRSSYDKFEENKVGYPKVQGKCPACGMHSLFLGEGGYVTCGILSCTNPTAANQLLENG